MNEAEKQLLLQWKMFLQNLSDYARVGKQDGLTFFINPNEQGHNKGHLHVKYGDAEMVIFLENGEIEKCTGKIAPPQKKMATKWVLDNQAFLINYWNEFTNGVKIPI